MSIRSNNRILDLLFVVISSITKYLTKRNKMKEQVQRAESVYIY